MNHLTEENLNILLKAMKIGFYKDFHRKGLLTDEQLAQLIAMQDKPNVLAEKTKINRGDYPDAPLITVRNHHEGIISRDLWNAVQAERLNRSKRTREGMRHSKKHWFSGLCTCGKCGYSFITTGSGAYPWRHVTCRNRQLYGTEKRTAMNGELIGCDNHTVDERILAKAMRSVMESIQHLSDSLKSMMMTEILSLKKGSGVEDISAKQEEVAKLKQKKLKAVDLMLKGLLDKEGLKEQTEFYDSEIKRLSEEISNHKDEETVFQRTDRIAERSDKADTVHNRQRYR